MKKIIPKINFNRENFIKVLVKCVSCKRLLFIIFFGALLIFTIDIVYKYAFINIEYINYEKDNSFIITNGKINNINLNRVLKNIDEDKKKITAGINKKYDNPFIFSGSEILNEFDNNEKDENIDNVLLRD